MGFTTGFIGGVTLTTAILYFTLNLHQRNRLYQSQLLHQQSALLTSITSPQAPLPPSTAREIRGGVSDRVKDRWNAELENSVRRLQNVDWNGLRAGLEERVGGMWEGVMKGSREGVAAGEAKLKQGVPEGQRTARQGVEVVNGKLREG